MPNVKREDHTIAELEAIVTNAKAELDEALQVYGEGSRQHTEAVNVLRLYERRLAAAKDKEVRRAENDKRDPAEIVDRIMRP